MTSLTRLLDRLSIAIETSMLLFPSAAFVGVFHVWRQNPTHREVYAVVAGVPALAAFLFLLAAAFVPNLTAVKSFRFPLNVSLPLAFCGLLLASEMLWTTSPNALSTGHEVLQFATLWTIPGVLIETLLLQVILLTLRVLLTPTAASG